MKKIIYWAIKITIGSMPKQLEESVSANAFPQENEAFFWDPLLPLDSHYFLSRLHPIPNAMRLWGPRRQTFQV